MALNSNYIEGLWIEKNKNRRFLLYCTCWVEICKMKVWIAIENRYWLNILFIIVVWKLLKNCQVCYHTQYDKNFV